MSPKNDTHLNAGTVGDVLLLSMRNLAQLVGYCAQYEFEDVIAAVTGADCVNVGNEPALEFSRRSYKAIRLTSRSRWLAQVLAPHPSMLRLQRNYELFFPIFNHPYELYALSSIPNWRERCRLAACHVSEVWIHQLPRYLLELLSQFDHVFVGMRHCVEAVGHITGRPCTYLPLAADVVRFSPWPSPPERSIDVCNIGRRSPVAHGALLALARSRSIFYYFDTFAGGAGRDRDQRTFRVEDHRQHRLLLAELLRHSRYYVANRSRANEPNFTANRQEISGRFFEGAAAGTVMLGEAPEMTDFKELFDWQDAVINVSFDCADIERVLAELDSDPERLLRIRCQNSSQAALRHDWVHRLHHVFDVLGLPSTSGMIQREQQLRALSDQALSLQGAGKSAFAQSVRA
jgi:hypothetical protein